MALAVLSGCAAGSGTDQASPKPASAAAPAATPREDRPFLVIAHRGASGYRPEHTLVAYQLAIDQGADFIEPDLVPTRDGHLIARHENALATVELDANHNIRRDAAGKPRVVSATTNIAELPQFAHLLRVRDVDGRLLGGWFSEDLTLAEIKTLRARERIIQLRPANAEFNDLPIPSLAEVIELLQQPQNAHVGMYPELKHPTHFRWGKRQPNEPADSKPANPTSSNGESINIDTAQLLVNSLQRSGFNNPARLFIQCFEVAPLLRLHNTLLPAAGLRLPLVQLFGRMNSTPADVRLHLQTPEQMPQRYGALADALATDASYRSLARHLARLPATHLAGVGPRKTDTRFVADLFKPQGLAIHIHPYTVRAEAFFLSKLRGGMGPDVNSELDKLRALGATGVFIDQPDLGVSWRAAQQTAPAP